ncbi:DUF4199 domain-containing protein [Aureisphaera sp. CAU 1614]|uniref:DUF4199 domain-containing protein n=1 Tax=Halomarinibacterium sedimenti TaxID=2857106 RepID=A0A9X1JVU3_9FLAO|nr:DUF4199 domain-containing protein [Halomarinibacterium sedimenti]MBW2938135.1 DUF4199 domain-containing protein [Halomarinibacterium sedimenti]
MDNQKASLKKIALNYGLLLGLASIALSVITYVMGVHLERPWWASVIGIIIMAALIVYGLKAFKQDNEGFLSLGEAIKVGLAISVIAGILGAVYNYVFVTVIEPDFVAQMMEITREQMIEQNPTMTEEQMEMGLSITEKFMSPGIMSAMAIIFTLFLGFIISLISGLIMKQNRPEGY